MKIKNIVGTIFALGAMALMAVGVQAATYSAGALVDGTGSVDGIDKTKVTVPVVVTPDENETEVKINGYAMTFTYDPTIVSPVATDDADSVYAVAGTEFAGDYSVIVSDKKSLDTGKEQVVVAWAAADPVVISDVASMATIDFTVVDDTAKSADVDVAVLQLTNDGASIADSASYTVSNGVVDLINDVEFILGDVDGDKSITGLDSTILFQYTSGSIDLETLKSMVIDPDNVELRSDVDKDGSVTGLDSTILFQLVSGAIDSFS